LTAFIAHRTDTAEIPEHQGRYLCVRSHSFILDTGATRMLKAKLFHFHCAALLAICTSASAFAAEQSQDRDLSELSLQELTDLEVTSLSKRPQLASQAPAAIFVLTQDDIRRSGANTIPEALRMVPGLQVSQIDGNKWAITARGFNGRFANKLLVLMDGRTVYTPSFSGVYWDLQDTLIDDIERIEVIRGPAGTVWGTNAVNGIINVITKHTDQTGGVLATGEIGTHQSGTVNARIGSADAGPVHWRAFARYSTQGDNLQLNGTDAFDSWQQTRVGGRADIALSGSNSLRTSMELFRGESGDTLSGSFLTPTTNPNTPALRGIGDIKGIWAAANFVHRTGSDSRVEMQLNYDSSDRAGSILSEKRETLDLDFQHELAQLGIQKITWGLGLRYNQDHLALGNLNAIVPSAYHFWLASGYLQDEVALFDGRGALTAGLRLENATLGGTAVLPNMRVQFAATQHSSIWAAVARGERRPSRAERDISLPNLIGPIPPGVGGNTYPLPITFGVVGDSNFGSEKLIAYESGFRWQPHSTLSFDLAIFYNDYRQLRGGRDLDPTCLPSGASITQNPACFFTASGIRLLRSLTNQSSGDTFGGELVARWTPSANWRLTGTYSHITKQLEAVEPNDPAVLFGQGQDAENEYAIRSTVSFGPHWDWDLFTQHRDKIPLAGIDSYTRVDTRIAWRPALDIELSLAGKNLLKPSHTEALSEFLDLMPVEIRRSIYFQARWSLR
jgi:iron complex outermembrane receptor protein